MPRMIRRRTPRRAAPRRGAACVEFAFAAPFIFMLVFGSVEFSRIVMVKQAMTNAAREGSRKAALVNTIDKNAVDAVARQALRGTIAKYDKSDKVQIAVSPQNLSGLASGTEITVTISVSTADVTWLPAMFFTANTISTSAKMKRE